MTEDSAPAEGARESYPPSKTRRMSATFHRKTDFSTGWSTTQRSRFHVKQPTRPTSTFMRARDLSEVTPSLADPYGDEPTPLAQAAEHMLLARQGPGCGEPLARPEATRVLVVANQKGGVGKTTSTVNVAAALAQFGQRVLVVDLDPQGNASTALDVEHHRGTPSTYDLLVEGRPLAEVVTTCPDVDEPLRGPRDHRPGRRRDRAGQRGGPRAAAAQGAARRPPDQPPAGGERGGGPVRLRLHRLPAVAGAAHPQRPGRRPGDDDPDPGGVLRPGGARPAARPRSTWSAPTSTPTWPSRPS